MPPKSSTPPLLLQYEAVNQLDIDKLKGFMEHKGITSTVPIEALSSQDFYRMFTYVIFNGREPECLKPKFTKLTNAELDNIFYTSTEGYGIDKQLYLAQLRTAINVLRSVGYDVDVNSDLSEIKADIKEFTDKYNSISSDVERYKNQYKELSKIGQIIRNASSPHFLYEKDKYFQDEIIFEEKDQKDINNKDAREASENTFTREDDKEKSGERIYPQKENGGEKEEKDTTYDKDDKDSTTKENIEKEQIAKEEQEKEEREESKDKEKDKKRNRYDDIDR
jgi:hypothetical protein